MNWPWRRIIAILIIKPNFNKKILVIVIKCKLIIENLTIVKKLYQSNSIYSCNRRQVILKEEKKIRKSVIYMAN